MPIFIRHPRAHSPFLPFPDTKQARDKIIASREKRRRQLENILDHVKEQLEVGIVSEYVDYSAKRQEPLTIRRHNF
jgi:hypothetical protein